MHGSTRARRTAVSGRRHARLSDPAQRLRKGDGRGKAAAAGRGLDPRGRLRLRLPTRDDGPDSARLDERRRPSKTSERRWDSSRTCRRIPTPSFHDVTAPNANTLYSTAWLDLSAEPYVLSLPDEHGRYYLMPMLSGWTDVIESPGKRTTGTGAQRYVIAGPELDGHAERAGRDARQVADEHGVDHRPDLRAGDEGGHRRREPAPASDTRWCR